MSVFDDVKQLDLILVAEKYGLSTRNSMINCLFHDDRTPSMKLYHDHYYCFGCGAHGDVIAFTAKLFGLSPLEAAKKLQSDFGITVSGKPSIPAQIKIINKQEQEKRTFKIITNYCNILRSYRTLYAPKSSDEELHPLFIESLKELDKYEYLFDYFLNATDEERHAFIAEWKEVLNGVEQKIRKQRNLSAERNVVA